MDNDYNSPVMPLQWMKGGRVREMTERVHDGNKKFAESLDKLAEGVQDAYIWLPSGKHTVLLTHIQIKGSNQ